MRAKGSDTSSCVTSVSYTHLKTKVEAEVVEQFKGEKQIIFKFKKRKNYKRTRGHRQNLTRVKIVSVGSAKAKK